MTHATVFVVSDDPAIRDSLAELAASAGLRAETFSSIEAWLEATPSARRGCLVLDARVSDFAGPERLSRFAAICARRPVLLLIDRGDVPIAVRALKGGAVDVLEKPYRDQSLLERIQRAAAIGQDAEANASG